MAVSVLIVSGAIVILTDNALGAGVDVKMNVVAFNYPTSYLLIDVWDIPEEHPVDDGQFNGWCVDYYHQIEVDNEDPDFYYDAVMWYSYDPALPSYLTDNEEWDMINYVINHRGDTTSNFVQLALWWFVGVDFDYESYPDAAALIDDAEANGEGYVPTTTDEIVAYILYIDDSTQATIIEVPFVPDDEEYTGETAWAYGEYTFIDEGIAKNWGWFFDYTVGDHDEDNKFSTPIYAGAGKNVITKGYQAGTLYVWEEDDELHIMYDMVDDVYISLAHAYVGTQKPTTAAPGQLGYNSGYMWAETEYTFDIDLTWPDDTLLYIAAHCDVWAQ
jgi:hypothetical protein